MSIAMMLAVGAVAANYLGASWLEPMLCPLGVVLFPLGLVLHYRTL